MSNAQLEKRLAALEAEVDQLKRKSAEPSANGWRKHVGIFANDPAFEEAMRIGRAYRESQRPKPSKKLGKGAARAAARHRSR